MLRGIIAQRPVDRRVSRFGRERRTRLATARREKKACLMSFNAIARIEVEMDANAAA